MGMAGVDINQRIESCVTEAATALGYTCLKDKQRECIISVLNRRDVFAVLPTGFGKKACFTCLPSSFDCYEDRINDNKAIIIVVSPLTALIYDQVEDLLRRIVSAGYIDAENEAHCVVKWGLSFREAFSRLKEVRSLMESRIGIMGLTATATRSLRLKVEEMLGMRSPIAIVRSPDEPNLRFSAAQLQGLGRDFTHPPGASSYIFESRLVDKFFKGTSSIVKKKIIDNFTKQSCLRVIILYRCFWNGD
uniref:DNA 3'-5' helicase n=1 Tax=Amphimedon queenslandica TaxID=400682 RepID=A0A1X7VXF8_AMPQE